MNNHPRKPFLYVVVCAAGIAGDAYKLITSAHEQGWDVGVIATPQGLGFLDTEAVEAQTGYSIRSAWRSPGDPRPLLPADAIAVAPATFNTANKWAAGIADTLTLGIPCEAYGMGSPTGGLPYVNAKHGRPSGERPEAGAAVGEGRDGRFVRAPPAEGGRGSGPLPAAGGRGAVGGQARLNAIRRALSAGEPMPDSHVCRGGLGPQGDVGGWWQDHRYGFRTHYFATACRGDRGLS